MNWEVSVEVSVPSLGLLTCSSLHGVLLEVTGRSALDPEGRLGDSLDSEWPTGWKSLLQMLPPGDVTSFQCRLEAADVWNF